MNVYEIFCTIINIVIIICEHETLTLYIGSTCVSFLQHAAMLVQYMLWSCVCPFIGH